MINNRFPKNMNSEPRGERESGRNHSGANGKVDETSRGAKRLRAKGKVGEMIRGRTGKWAKRLGFFL